MSSRTKTLKDLLKELERTGSISGLSALLVDSEGNLKLNLPTAVPLIAETSVRTQDANTATKTGIYLLPNGAVNAPAYISRGVMFTLEFPPNVYQLLIANRSGGPQIIVRQYVGDGAGWSDWKIITTT